MREYDVKELHGEPGDRHEVTVRIDPTAIDSVLLKALISTGALIGVKDFKFTINDDCPSIVFRVPSQTEYWIRPKIHEAYRILNASIAEAIRLHRIFQALQLVYPKGR